MNFQAWLICSDVQSLEGSALFTCFYIFTRESCQHLALTLAVEQKGEAHGIEQLTHCFAMWTL